MLAAAGALVGLLAPGRFYDQETDPLADAASAQDLVQLLVVTPLILWLGLRAALGSVPARLTWLGCLAFTAYNYAIYAFAIHFGPLFLPWVATLGLSSYAFGGSLATLDVAAVSRRFEGRSQRLTGWTLVLLATLFAALWLSGVATDLWTGTGSSSAADWKLPTNPVHVLDLALFLPAVMAAGLLLLRRRPLGYVTAPGALVFLALTCLPILVTPLVAGVRDHATTRGVLLPIGVVLVVTLLVLRHTLSGLRVPAD